MLPEFRSLLSKNVLSFSKLPVRFKSQRRTLGKPPGVARTLAQRMEEMNYEDPKVCFKVNIGFLKSKSSRRELVQKHVEHLKKNRNDPSLEMAAMNNSLIVPLNEVEEDWAVNSGPEHITAAAQHYGIFEHLFGDAMFYPVVPLKINYSAGDDLHPVYRGNYLTPDLSNEAPQISFKAQPDSLWTVLMTTPDGHLQDGEKEYVHWLIGNIKGNDLNSGEVLFPYVQPFPMKGIGYLRYIFILFKQEQKIDYSNLQNKISSTLDLSERTFSTYDFYRMRETQLTPAGLAWFQADWDQSVSEFFHKKLGFEEEPNFMYDFPKPYYKKQEWFPLRRPFNLYLDRYRDEKDIAKDYLKRKLKQISPFTPPAEQYAFPNAVPIKKNVPSWLKNEMRKRRLFKGRALDYKFLLGDLRGESGPSGEAYEWRGPDGYRHSMLSNSRLDENITLPYRPKSIFQQNPSTHLYTTANNELSESVIWFLLLAQDQCNFILFVILLLFTIMVLVMLHGGKISSLL